MSINKELLDILVCPVCKVKVTLDGEDKLVCGKCHKQYPIKDGIPVMLVAEEEKHG